MSSEYFLFDSSEGQWRSLLDKRTSVTLRLFIYIIRSIMNLVKRSMTRELIAFVQIGTIEEECNVLYRKLSEVTTFSAFESHLVHFPSHPRTVSL